MQGLNPAPLYLFVEWEPTKHFIGEMNWQARKNDESRLGNAFNGEAAENNGYTVVGPERSNGVLKERYIEFRKSVKLSLSAEERALYGGGY